MVTPEINRETLYKNHEIKVERMKAHDGWIVLITAAQNISSCYVPDKKHKWFSNKELRVIENNKQLDNKSSLFNILLTKLSDVISDRVCRALKYENYHFVGDIVCDKTMINEKSFALLKRLNNIGDISYDEIIESLAKLGFLEPIENNEYWSARSKIGVIRSS